MEGGASLAFFRNDVAMINPKETPPAVIEPLLKSQTDGEMSDDGSMSVDDGSMSVDDGSMSVTKKRNHNYTKLS